MGSKHKQPLACPMKWYGRLDLSLSHSAVLVASVLKPWILKRVVLAPTMAGCSPPKRQIRLWLGEADSSNVADCGSETTGSCSDEWGSKRHDRYRTMTRKRMEVSRQGPSRSSTDCGHQSPDEIMTLVMDSSTSLDVEGSNSSPRAT